MEKILKWTVLFIVMIILASGGVAFYSVFYAEKDTTLIPSFRERSLLDAKRDAEQMGLRVQVEEVESKLPMGIVIAQWPEPGTKMHGIEKNIILKVSKSGERSPIPDVRGMEVGRATRMLEEQGFQVRDIIRIKDSSDNKLPAGQVISQSPAAPGSIPVGYLVDLLVSEGSDTGRIAVPNVAQMTERAARSTLEGVGLRVASVETRVNNNIPEGEVLSTLPATGAMVREGEGIKLIIAKKEEPRPVPEVHQIPGRPTEPRIYEEIDLSISNLDQPRRPIDPNVMNERTESLRNDPHSPEFNTPPTTGTTTTPTTPTTGTTTTPSVTASPETGTNTGNKVAKIRYQVPPILRPLPLKIDIEDARGKRVLLERNVRGNESVQIDGNYTQEANVEIWLGGESVWQERFK